MDKFKGKCFGKMHENLNGLVRRKSGEKELNNEDEVFRVYFKCLMREETVMNAKMCFGGIGVAICDRRDFRVFELQKPMSDDRQVVELESLIESLNAALTLGLTRIHILSDSNPVYQYFTGGWKPSTNKKIATLVRQLNLIQTKFAYFVPVPVAQDDLKFAYKLARDAIAAQVTDCTNIKTLANQDKFYCPFLKCLSLMSRTKLQEGDASSSQATGMRKCVECDRLFCMNCQVPWHPDVTCSYFMKHLSDRYVIDPKLKSLAVKNNLIQCIKCKVMVERAAGCYHISCSRCGYEFCYKCGAERIKNKPTCKCPIQDRRKH